MTENKRFKQYIIDLNNIIEEFEESKGEFKVKYGGDDE